MKKRLLLVLLALCMALALLPGMARAEAASGSCGDGVTWSYSNGTLTIQGTGPMDAGEIDHEYAEIILPWSDYRWDIQTVIIGEGVTSIGENAFYECRALTSVAIPNSITSIEGGAFFNCGSLTSVVIPDSVTSIGTGAFSWCESLTSMTIPDSVTSIGEGAFYRCIGLPGFHVSNGNTAYSTVDGVLFSADQTLLHTYPAGRSGPYSVPASVTTIGGSAFQTCSNLTSVTIPDGVTAIGDSAFAFCESLTSVTIPSSVTTIADFAFCDSGNLADIYYGGSEGQWNRITIGEYNEPLSGVTIHYNTPISAGTPSTPAKTTSAAPTPTVMLSTQKLAVNGRDIDCEKYNIDGNNFFKLRDLAYVLNGTGSQFEVGFDRPTRTVTITPGAAYTPNGTELGKIVDHSSTAQLSRQTILIDGVKRDDLTVYNIGGNNFFKLRDLGGALGFEADYDAASRTTIVRSIQKAETSGPSPAEPVNQTALSTREFQRILVGEWSNAYREEDVIYTTYYNFIVEGELYIGSFGEYYNIHKAYFPDEEGDEYGWYIAPMGYPAFGGNYSLTASGINRFTLEMTGSYDVAPEESSEYSCELTYVDNNTISIDGKTYVRGMYATLVEYAGIFGFDIEA